mgnify:CR=1 FL=1
MIVCWPMNQWTKNPTNVHGNEVVARWQFCRAMNWQTVPNLNHLCHFAAFFWPQNAFFGQKRPNLETVHGLMVVFASAMNSSFCHKLTNWAITEGSSQWTAESTTILLGASPMTKQKIPTNTNRVQVRVIPYPPGRFHGAGPPRSPPGGPRAEEANSNTAW